MASTHRLLLRATANRPRCSKCWYYGYGGSLSSDRTLIFNDKIKRVAERFVDAINKSSKEHPSRTRGLGNVPWKVGFIEDRGSYREQRTLSEADANIRSLEANDQRPTEEAQPEKRCPINDLKHRCPCELHILMRNLTTPIVHGAALPVLPGQKYHCYDIPPGYSTVSMEQVVSIYEDLELEHKGGDGERILKEVIHGMILWQKAYIKLVAENRDGGTTTAASTATGGGSRIESPRRRSPNNNPSPLSAKSHTKPPTYRSPPPCKSSKLNQKKTSESARKGSLMSKPRRKMRRLTMVERSMHYTGVVGQRKITARPRILPRWPYELEKPLVSPDELKALPTQMRRFHDWYMAMCYKQPSGNNHCGYYVCEAMHIFIGIKSITKEVMKLKDQCLPDQRLTAIQEH
ncbi:hypothetical protein BS78_05G153500 [Paspalum vaginatum]|nr:hypothetical protein BS78_05G153500 [Paspalum vaginatum]